MYSIIKRLFDFLLSFSLIVLGMPVFLLISLWIIISMGLPVIFSQERTGRNSRSFMIYKFRTMRERCERYLTDEQRITWTGRTLRSFRLDELPQLFNILKGDMSFIGPRPLLPSYLPFYTNEELRRHNVRPGLSGLSQVNHLHYPDWETQFSDDIEYVNHICLKTDLIILFKTLQRIAQPHSMKLTNINQRPNFITYRERQNHSKLSKITSDH